MTTSPARSGSLAEASAFLSVSLGLPCLSTLVGGNVREVLVPIGWEFAHRALGWGAQGAVLVCVGFVVAAAITARRARPSAEPPEPDFRPPGARAITMALDMAFVSVPIWLLVTLWLTVALAGVSLYLEKRGAGPARAASCEVLHCRRYQCAVACELAGGERVRGACFRDARMPRARRAFRAALRRGPAGTWLVDLSSIAAAAPADARPR